VRLLETQVTAGPIPDGLANAEKALAARGFAWLDEQIREQSDRLPAISPTFMPSVQTQGTVVPQRVA
jgi:hypothetical protein